LNEQIYAAFAAVVVLVALRVGIISFSQTLMLCVFAFYQAMVLIRSINGAALVADV